MKNWIYICDDISITFENSIKKKQKQTNKNKNKSDQIIVENIHPFQ
jgi:hypothetical protein